MAGAAIDFCRAICQIARRPGNCGAHAPSLRGQAEASAADRNNANNRNNDNGFRVVVVHASRRTAHHPGSSELPGWFSAELSSPASNARRRPARRRAAAKSERWRSLVLAVAACPRRAYIEAARSPRLQHGAWAGPPSLATMPPPSRKLAASGKVLQPTCLHHVRTTSPTRVEPVSPVRRRFPTGGCRCP